MVETARAYRTLIRPLSVPGFVLLVLASGCDGSPTEVDLPLLQTEGEAYELRPSGKGFETEIVYGFDNQTGGDVYLVNCLGGFQLALDRWEDREWVPNWAPVLFACLSSAIVIEQGEVFSDTLHIWGALPGTSAAPSFATDELEGTYRIRWVDAYPSVRDNLGSGPPIPEEYRVSNSFDLSAP